MSRSTDVPGRAWLVAGAGTAVNLCLGILYAWSVWKSNLVAVGDHEPGDPMAGLNEGWRYLSNAEDEALINSPDWRERTAGLVVKAIDTYFLTHVAQRSQ